jgi:AraC-like DNA-binding protein
MFDERQHCCGNGKKLFGHDVTVSLPRTSLDLHETHKDYCGCWITLDLDAVVEHAMIDAAIGGFDRPGRFEVSGCASDLRNSIAYARNELFRPGSNSVSPRMIAAFEKSLLSMSAQILSMAFDAQIPPKRINLVHRRRLLLRACEVIDAKLGDGLTMQELCSFVGASRRTLENIFLEALDLSPYQYVRALRLNVIRREILATENRRVPIGDVAAKYGIWHLSRFAADYKIMFGCSPSRDRWAASNA